MHRNGMSFDICPDKLWMLHIPEGIQGQAW